MSTTHHRRLLGTNKAVLQDCLTHRLSQIPILPPPIRIILNLPSPLRSKRRRSPHPLGPPHHPFLTQPLSCQHAPLLSHHRPFSQAEPRPIPSIPPATLRGHRLRHAAQNQKPTSAQR